MKLALVASYSEDGDIPQSTIDYVMELQKYMDKVVILKNCGIIKTSVIDKLKGVELCYQLNTGRDFGHFYQYLISNDVSQYDEILYTNDSVIMVRMLTELMDWISNNPKEYLSVSEGIITLKDKQKEHRYSFNESRFIYTKGITKQKVVDYILQKGIQLDKNYMIYEYEVGLSQEFVTQRDTYINTNKLFGMGCYPHKLGDNNKPDNNGPFIPSYRRPIHMLTLNSPFVKYKFENEGYISNYKLLIDHLASIVYSGLPEYQQTRHTISS